MHRISGLDDGVWMERQHAIGLGHHRFSVVDLSPAGHQPMHSASDRYVVVFNGEIYGCTDLTQNAKVQNDHTIRCVEFQKIIVSAPCQL